MKKSRREFLALSGAGLLATSLPGGVSAILDIAPKAKIYLHPTATEPKFGPLHPTGEEKIK